MDLKIELEGTSHSKHVTLINGSQLDIYASHHEMHSALPLGSSADDFPLRLSFAPKWGPGGGGQEPLYTIQNKGTQRLLFQMELYDSSGKPLWEVRRASIGAGGDVSCPLSAVVTIEFDDPKQPHLCLEVRPSRRLHTPSAPGPPPPDALDTLLSRAAASASASTSQASQAAVEEDRAVLARLQAALPFPYTLLHVRALGPQMNPPGFGLTLSDITHGFVGLAVVSSYLVEVNWLLRHCPGLDRAQKIVFLLHPTGQFSESLDSRDVDSALPAMVAFQRRAAAQGREVSWWLPRGAKGEGGRMFVHHSKFLLLAYPGGLRVSVISANLRLSDTFKNQTAWTQDFPWRPETAAPGAAAAGSAVAASLETYVRRVRSAAEGGEVGAGGQADLDVIVSALRRADLSSARVHPVFTCPVGGILDEDGGSKYGLLAVAEGLRDERARQGAGRGPPTAGAVREWAARAGVIRDRAIIGQFSSFSDPNPDHVDRVLRAFAGESLDGPSTSSRQPAGGRGAKSNNLQPWLRFVWPPSDAVRRSVEGYSAGSALPSSATAVDGALSSNVVREGPGRGGWLGEGTGGGAGVAGSVMAPLMGMYRWDGVPGAEERGEAMPHMKVFFECLQVALHEGPAPLTLIPHLYSGSHNLSRGAWGDAGPKQAEGGQRKRPAERWNFRHFEMGYLLTPSLEAAYLSHPHRGFLATAPPSDALSDTQRRHLPPPPLPGVPLFFTPAAPGLPTPTLPGVYLVPVPLPFEIPIGPAAARLKYEGSGTGSVPWFSSKGFLRGIPVRTEGLHLGLDRLGLTVGQGLAASFLGLREPEGGGLEVWGPLDVAGWRERALAAAP